MVSRKDGFSIGNRPGALVALVLVAALAACNPIETVRGLTGMSRNDPDPATTPNTKNLAAGADMPYPNLATVPPPPTQAMTEAERNRLTQSLIADRSHPSYSAAPETPGFAPAAAEPPPPPPAPPVLASTAKPAASVPGAAKPSPTGAAARKPGEPPAPAPMESSLQTPQIPTLPGPGQVQPPPPPPNMPAVPAPSATPYTVPAAKLASAAPQPPPGAPVLTAPPPAPVLPSSGPARPGAAGATAAPGAKIRAAVSSVPAGALDFPGSATGLPAGDDATIAKAAALYKAEPGVVRVTVYADATAAGGGSAQLNGFQVALDRAHAIAAALAAAGVPAAKVQTTAIPAGGGMPPGHAVLLLER
jgi:outer membrane protein OmpA-like peptidoglycan-associated protein